MRRLNENGQLSRARGSLIPGAVPGFSSSLQKNCAEVDPRSPNMNAELDRNSLLGIPTIRLLQLQAPVDPQVEESIALAGTDIQRRYAKINKAVLSIFTG